MKWSIKIFRATYPNYDEYFYAESDSYRIHVANKKQ
jgi:hypothetical protein